MHLVMSMSYRVVRLEPSSRSSASIVMACAGHTASHSLHAMQRSSPEAYLFIFRKKFLDALMQIYLNILIFPTF